MQPATLLLMQLMNVLPAFNAENFYAFTLKLKFWGI